MGCCACHSKFSNTKPLPVLPRSSQSDEVFEGFLEVGGFGAGEVFREVGGGDGGLGGVEGLLGGADAVGERLRPWNLQLAHVLEIGA